MKNYSTSPFAWLFSFYLVLAGCSTPKLYVSSNVNAPLLSEKGDGKFNFFLNPSGDDTSFEFQGAYAMSNHLAASFTTALLGTANKHSHRLLEGGMGYYSSFWPDEDFKNKGRVEIFANYGFGWSKSIFEKEDTEYSGRYQRFSIQPGFGISFEFGEVAVGFRYAFTRFQDYKYYEGSRLVEDKQLRFNTFDPYINFGVGSEKVRMLVMLNPVLPMSREEDYFAVTGDDDLITNFIFLNPSFGVSFLFYPSSQ